MSYQWKYGQFFSRHFNKSLVPYQLLFEFIAGHFFFSLKRCDIHDCFLKFVLVCDPEYALKY